MPVILLALLQAVTALVPELEEIWPSIEAVFEGTATAADLVALQGVTTALNAKAANAESIAGAT